MQINASSGHRFRAPSGTFRWGLGSRQRPLEVAAVRASRCVLIWPWSVSLRVEGGARPGQALALGAGP